MYSQLNAFVGKKCLQNVWTNMQLLLIAQSELCLPGSAEINFCINFERYDLPNGVTPKAQIWYATFDSS